MSARTHLRQTLAQMNVHKAQFDEILSVFDRLYPAEADLDGVETNAKLSRILDKVREEVKRAESLYPPMASLHEGHSVLKEEQEELWDEIKKSPKKRDMAKIEEEGVQTAAMAVRFLLDLVDM